MNTEILTNLKKAVLECDPTAGATWAQKALEERIDPLVAMDALTEGIRQVGEEFGRGERWLPELVGAANAMKSASAFLEGEIRKVGKKRETIGVVVLGTVKGDIHDIGKNIVATLLLVSGFTVIDLGADVPAQKFIDVVKINQANILGLSALLTTTRGEQKKIIDTLIKEGLREKVKVMVGGAAITQEFANNIGADGYDPTAIGAVRLARKLTSG